MVVRVAMMDPQEIWENGLFELRNNDVVEELQGDPTGAIILNTYGAY